MTIRMPMDLKDRLGRLADATRRSKSFLAAEALEAYVRHELQIIEDIFEGRKEIAESKGIPHDVAMDQIDAMIAEMGNRKA